LESTRFRTAHVSVFPDSQDVHAAVKRVKL
jgi:hypothetical protein